MIRLYFSPSACSLASHICLREIGAEFELIQVDLQSKRTADHRDFHSVNPKGYVPALEIDRDVVLTENAAVLQYIADSKPAAELVPPAGTLGRYRLQEWLSFVATELHKVFTPFFDPDAAQSARTAARARLAGRLDWLAAQLTPGPYLLGAHFSVADAYLFVILRATAAADLRLRSWPALQAYHDRIEARPPVTQALKVESEVKPVG